MKYIVSESQLKVLLKEDRVTFFRNKAITIVINTSPVVNKILSILYSKQMIIKHLFAFRNKQTQ